MVRERNDSGLWISLWGEFVGSKVRLKSIMPHGDIYKGKITFQVSFSLASGIFLASYNLALCIAS
jgi:hypothetical protein